MPENTNAGPTNRNAARRDPDSIAARSLIAVAGVVGAAALFAFSNPPEPTEAPAVRFGDVELSTGVRLRFAEQGPADGVPVILLHGFSDTWYSFSRNLPALSPRVHAYVLDQRGHGDSERPPTGYTMPQLAADVIAFMDAKGIARATVVGHSMGGFVGQQVALAAPSRVSSLVLVGTGTSVRGFNGMAEFEAALQTLTDPVPLEFTREFQVSTIFHPIPPEFVDRVSEDSRKLPALAWRGLMRGMMTVEVARGLTAARIPTVLIWGDKDVIVPRAAQDSLLAILPHAKLTVYEQTGHAVHWERPERFVRDLESVLGVR